MGLVPSFGYDEMRFVVGDSQCCDCVCDGVCGDESLRFRFQVMYYDAVSDWINNSAFVEERCAMRDLRVESEGNARA